MEMRGQVYKNWLEENLPADIELDFRSGCCGVDGGLFDENYDEIESGGNEWWTAYCEDI